MMTALDFDAIAFSYLRFSTPEQAKGDSQRRQTVLRDAWLKRNPRVSLDTSLTLRDLGKSAFTGEHRKNPDRHALAAFLKLVHDGKIPKGSYFIIENLDRLTREDERAALRLWMDILDAGINIVQLEPETIFRHEKSDMLDIIRAIIEMSRGHGESVRKSKLNGATWQQKLVKAREGKDQPPRRSDGRVTKAITARLPAWVEERAGELVLIPERAAVVKRIFAMAAAGYGIASTVKRLTDEKVAAFGDFEPYTDEEGKPRRRAKDGALFGAGVWVRAYVAKVLKDRRALGEHQPRGKGRKPEGDPITNYFPAVVAEAEWLAARAGATERKRKPGRVSEHVNLFSGLLRHARDGDTFFIGRQRGAGQRVLANTAGAEGRTRYYSFPAETFERAVLSMLREIDPHDILNGDQGPDETVLLASEQTRVEAKIAELEAELLQGDVAALAKVLRQLEGQKRTLVERLAAARQKAANPLSESWGECQSLIDALDSAPDQQDARLRLRSALRRIVSGIWALVVPRGRNRLCAAQIWFADDKRCRDYLIIHSPPKGNASARTAGHWSAHSLAGVVKTMNVDLRKPDHVRRLETGLLELDVTVLGG